MKIKRDAFLYLDPKEEIKKDFAQCRTCTFWTGDKTNNCLLHGKDYGIDGLDSCGFYIAGKQINQVAGKGLVTPSESGLIDDVETRCQNCKFYEADHKLCGLYDDLNKKSPELFDLESIVNPYGCCNAMINKKMDQKESDTSSAQHKSIFSPGSKKKRVLTKKELEEILERLEVDRSKWSDCVHDVLGKGEDVNAYAVCTTSVGTPDKKESAKYNFKTRLREKDSKPDGQIFDVVLIQEGLGNFKDSFFYTKEALQNAVDQFEGKKIYADHPSALEDEVRPERSTKDILGYFENVEYVETNGRGELHADLCIPPEPSFDWARSMAKTAIVYREKYGDKDFVGLSINASGDADEVDIDEMIDQACDACKDKLIEAKNKGIESVRKVSQIQDAVSCDLVTEAGAGGKILKLMEEAKVSKDEKTKQKIKEAAEKVAKEKHHENEDEADGAGSDDSAGADHSDADQDTKLFKHLFDKYMGDGGGDDSEGEESEECESEHGIDGAPHPDADAVKEKYEGYKEMGMEADDAMKHAVAHHKMEKMKQKKESEKKEAGQPDPSQLAPGKKQESSKEAVKLAGRVAMLERKLSQVSLEKHVSEKLKESGLPRKATQLFVEKAGEFKSEKDFDEKFNLFKEAYNVEREEEISFIGGYEKTSTEVDKGISFDDCVK